MEIHPLMKSVLLKINFIVRYKQLSKKHQNEDSFENYEVEPVLEMIKKSGYNSKFKKNGTFFEIIQKKGQYIFQLNICLKYGLVELILGVEKGKERLAVGGPFGHISTLLGEEDKIFKPSFVDYNELNEILKESFEIFEDIKKEALYAHP
jgi:hypothetical protein